MILNMNQLWMNMKSSFNINKILGFFIGLYIISLPLFSFREEYFMLTNLIAGIAVGLFLIKVLLNKGYLKISPFFFFFLSFIVFGLFTFLYAINKEYVFKQSITLFLNFILCLVVYNYIEKKSDLERIMKYFILGSLLSIGFIYYQSDIFSGERIGEVLANVNMLALIFFISLSFLTYFMISRKNWFLMIPGLIMFIFIILTGSRKGFLSIVLFILLMSLFLSKNWMKGIVKTLIVVVVLLTIFKMVIMKNEVFYSVLGKRIVTMDNYFSGNQQIDRSTAERAFMYQFGIEQIRKRPIWGYGLDNYRVLLLNSGLGRETYSHNNYIELLVNGGVIGLFLFYAMYFYLFWILRNYLKQKNLMATIFVINNLIIIILGMAMVHYTDKIFYLLLTMGYGINSVIKKEFDLEKEI